MRNRSRLHRIISVPLAALFVVSCIPSTVSAQALTGASSLAGVASSIQQEGDTVTDVFVGKGTRGPYVLTWKQIDPDSDTVVLNGATLRKGQDYTIDYGGGVVAFSQALKQGNIARITYRYTRGKAVANNSGISIPLNLTILQRTGKSLGFTGLLKQGDGTAVNPGVSVFGLNASADLGSVSKLTSQFMVSSIDDGNKSDDGGFWDRAAINLANNARYGDLQVKTSFLRTGENFAGANEYKLQPGQQLMDLIANYNPGSAVFATMSFKRTDDVGGENEGATNSLFEQRVVLTFPKAPKMTLLHTTNKNENSDGSVAQSTEISKLLMEQSIGKTASASAFIENQQVKDGAVEDDITTSQLNFNAAPNAKVKFASQLMFRDSEQLGGSNTFNFTVNATPDKAVKIALGYSQFDSEKQGAWNNTNLIVNAAAAKNINVEATYDVKSVEQQGDVTTAGVKVAATVNPKLDIKTSVLNKDATNAAGEQHRDVALVAKPADFINLSVGMGQKEVGDQNDASQSVRMELKPFEHTTMNGGYQYSEAGSVTSIIRDISAKTKPVSFFEFAGLYKTRDVTGMAGLDTMALQLKLDPVKWFKLTGQYAKNPEDQETGAVLRYDSTTLGIESTMGILSLRGGFTTKDEYMISRQYEEKRLGLSLKLFGNGRLTTDYSIAELVQGIQSATINYSLGYSHNIGSDFSLSVSGSMTQYERDQMVLKDQTEYKADLKVGVHF